MSSTLKQKNNKQKWMSQLMCLRKSCMKIVQEYLITNINSNNNPEKESKGWINNISNNIIDDSIIFRMFGYK